MEDIIQKTNAEVIRRLNALIALSLLSLQREGKGLSIREQAILLKNLNFKNIEVAKILGKTSTHIGKELSLTKKGGKGGRKKSK